MSQVFIQVNWGGNQCSLQSEIGRKHRLFKKVFFNKVGSGSR